MPPDEHRHIHPTAPAIRLDATGAFRILSADSKTEAENDGRATIGSAGEAQQALDLGVDDVGGGEGVDGLEGRCVQKGDGAEGLRDE